jgi:hypothetical protein
VRDHEPGTDLSVGRYVSPRLSRSAGFVSLCRLRLALQASSRSAGFVSLCRLRLALQASCLGLTGKCYAPKSCVTFRFEKSLSGITFPLVILPCGSGAHASEPSGWALGSHPVCICKMLRNGSLGPSPSLSACHTAAFMPRVTESV